MSEEKKDKDKNKIKNGQTLCFPIPIVDEALITDLKHTLEFVTKKGNEYLEFAHEKKLYDVFEESKSKYAYKTLEPIFAILQKKSDYVPSRVNRGILEMIGRSIRTLKTRKDLFGQLVSLTTDAKKWNSKLLKKHKVSANLEYVKNIKQQVLNFQKKHEKFPNDFYDLQKPSTLKTQMLSYAPDDGQAIKIDVEKNQVEIKLKLLTKEDKWQWRKTQITIPDFLQQQQISSPDIRISCIHGRWLPILDFKIVLPIPPKVKSNRFLTVDWGANRLATCCVFDSKARQISQPIFQHHKPMQRKLFLIRKDIDRLKKKRDVLKTKCSLYRKLNKEIACRWRKISAINHELSHLTANVIVFIAQLYGCSSIYCEDLKSLKSRDKTRDLNYKINSTVRQSIFSKVEYKSALVGIKLQKPIHPAGTSSICPKCSCKGTHVKASDNRKKNKKHHPWFYCPNCKFQADRDYVACLNIARKVIFKKSLKQLSQKTTVYTKVCLPDKLFRQAARCVKTESRCHFLKGWISSVFLSHREVRMRFNAFKGTIFGSLRT